MYKREKNLQKVKQIIDRCQSDSNKKVLDLINYSDCRVTTDTLEDNIDFHEVVNRSIRGLGNVSKK